MHRATQIQVIPLGVLRVRGERFSINLDADMGVVLEHRYWSLMGVGETLAEAERCLMTEARDLAEAMEHDSPARLDHHANRMRRFVLPFLASVVG